MDIKDLIKNSNLSTRAFGAEIGLSGSQISHLATGRTKPKQMIQMICRYKFWKELGISPKEIIEELRLSEFCNSGYNNYTNPDNYESENQNDSKIIQLEDERRVLIATIDYLNKQLEDK